MEIKILDPNKLSQSELRSLKGGKEHPDVTCFLLVWKVLSVFACGK